MKLWNYLVIFTTMMIFMEFVGIPTGISGTLSYFGVNINPITHQLISADLESSTFYGWLFGLSGVLIILSTVGTVIVGLFARSYDTSLVVLPAIISVGTLFTSTFIFLIQYFSESWAQNIMVVIFVPLGIGFLWSCVEFFRGIA
jgi:hypothetical protein